MKVCRYLLVAVVVMTGILSWRIACAQEDLSGAGAAAQSQESLVDDGTIYINEVGTLVSAPPPADYKGKPVYRHMFVDSKSRVLAFLPCEILERLTDRVRFDDVGATEVFMPEMQGYKKLAENEVIVFRVDRGIATRFGRQNYIVVEDGAYKVEARVGVAAKKKPEGGPAKTEKKPGEALGPEGKAPGGAPEGATPPPEAGKGEGGGKAEGGAAPAKKPDEDIF